MVIFICGIPASGKSTFGKYLKDNFGYFYIDMEHEWFDENLHAIWNLIFVSFEENRIRDFVNAVNAKSTNSALDLGFPLYNDNYFKIIPKLKEFDCQIVWFNCDEEIAKQRFLKRPDSPSIETFNTQMRNIRNNWDKVLDLINPVVINVLKSDKSGKTVEEIYNDLN